jgi:hypothetical protein
MRRERVNLSPLYSTVLEAGPGAKVGYIRLSSFTQNAGQDMHDALVHLKRQGCNGYVLDLRDNPGGLVHAGGCGKCPAGEGIASGSFDIGWDNSWVGCNGHMLCLQVRLRQRVELGMVCWIMTAWLCGHLTWLQVVVWQLDMHGRDEDALEIVIRLFGPFCWH